ncbi:unnamed protein product [Phaeothamnion confervicola]
MDRDNHTELSVIDPGMYRYDLVFGTTLGMTKEERPLYGESRMTHAMVLTGYNRREGEDWPNKWRVENSWGTKNGAVRLSSVAMVAAAAAAAAAGAAAAAITVGRSHRTFSFACRADRF